MDNEDELIEDEVEFSAPKAPSTQGEDVKSDPNDDSFADDEAKAKPDPDALEAYGAHEETVTETVFDNPLFQMIHKHPFWVTFGICVGGGIVFGGLATAIRFGKCGRL